MMFLWRAFTCNLVPLDSLGGLLDDYWSPYFAEKVVDREARRFEAFETLHGVVDHIISLHH